MSLRSRSTLLLLSFYVVAQLFVSLVLFRPSLRQPTRGSAAPLCASETFSREGAEARLHAYDTYPLLDAALTSTSTSATPSPAAFSLLPNARAGNQGEAVWMNLSLLREAFRDGWIYFGGDGTLKYSFYSFHSLFSRTGLTAPVSPRLAERQWQRRHRNAEERVGSSRLSFHYAPRISDIMKDWKKNVEDKPQQLPPALIIYSAGLWDAYGSSNGSQVGDGETESASLNDIDMLLSSIQSYLVERVSRGLRAPSILFLTSPTPVDSNADTQEEKAKRQRMNVRMAALTERLRARVQEAAAAVSLAHAKALQLPSISGPAATHTTGVLSSVAIADIAQVTTPNSGLMPAHRDDDGGDSVTVWLNPHTTAASMAAYSECHLGQPSWSLHAFTPGQIGMCVAWMAAIVAFIMHHTNKHCHQDKGYQRVSSVDEIELGQVNHGISGNNDGKGNGGGIGTHENGNKASTLTIDARPNQQADVGLSKDVTPSTSRSRASSLASLLKTTLSPNFSSTASGTVLSALVQVGFIIFFMFLLDGNQRLSWWLVGDKVYVRDTFLFVLVVILIIAWQSGSETTNRTEALLNREQTEEWKGVMQIVFVLYHFFAAKEMYNIIRVLIAAYVWMTGYGNFFFFYKTGDFSLARLSKMLFRLNFLVALVCIALNREFMQYYVCALHTFYFLMVYAMMGIAHQWNRNDALLCVKFLVTFIALFFLFDVPSLGLFHTVFAPFSLFYWKNSLHEWWFRAGLDHYATLIGMICAWKAKSIEQWLTRLGDTASLGSHGVHKRWAMQASVAMVAIAAGLLWMVYCLWLPKTAYNAQHPYTSIIPILLYILLRNLTPWLRRHVLFLFSWLGKITLETYILQFHVWLSDDAATILTYWPNYPLFNFILSTAIYVALSLLAFQLTNVLSDHLIPRGSSASDIIVKSLILTAAWTTIYNTCYWIMLITN